MTSVTEKLEFTSVNKQQSHIIWSRPSQAKKVISGEEKRFIINSVTFGEEGNYTQWTFWEKVASVDLVKVLCKFFSEIRL